LNLKKFSIEKNDKNQSRVFQVHSVGDFLELCTWLYANEQVAFRGQRSQEPLLPTVARNSEYIRAELKLFDDFKKEALPYLNYLPTSDWQWLAIAQHNGLPTRLLDWTKHSLAALWFAVEHPPHEDQSGVVWACGYDSGHFVSQEHCMQTPFEISKTSMYFPGHIFPFIQAQSGLFTVHHRSNGLFKPLEDLSDADLCLTKIEIPPNTFQTIRYHLFRGGIHAASLFPGLTGLVKKIRYQHKLLDDEVEAQTKQIKAVY
jgi:hypothetical protein